MEADDPMVHQMLSVFVSISSIQEHGTLCDHEGHA